jgi:hypothetical protein
MTRSANRSLRDATEDAADASLDDGWDVAPESSSLPIRSASSTPAPVSNMPAQRTVSAIAVRGSSRSDPSPSVLPPVSIAPRPRPSSRAPGPLSGGPILARTTKVTDRSGPTAPSVPGAPDDPTLEVSFQYLDDALMELVE